MKNNNLPKVTIAVCAYNEQDNIVSFLNSVLEQKAEGFTISKILVINDGSTDNTAKLVRSFGSSKIHLLDYKKRSGKSLRLNIIYSDLKDEFLLQSDADVLFSHNYVVRDMLVPLIKDKNVGMTGGNPMPLPSKTFIEKAVNCTTEVYINLRKEVRHGDNVLSADGRILAYRRELVKNITIPSDMIANDMYTYFCCLSLGKKYKFVQTAIVRFRSPQTIKDQIRQNSRFRAAPIRMKNFFAEELVEKELSIPTHLLFKHYLVTFINNPIHCLFIYFLNKYTKFIAVLNEKTMTAKWDIARTTKKTLAHA